MDSGIDQEPQLLTLIEVDEEALRGNLMPRLFLVACVMMLLAGCSDKAKDLFETAQLEEKQTNKPHATKLYRQILEQYPDSPYARQAKNRLAELEKR